MSTFRTLAAGLALSALAALPAKAQVAAQAPAQVAAATTAAAAGAVQAATVARPPAPAGAVEAIRARGHLLCGVSPGTPGFAVQEGREWRGMDADYCRGVASAILGDAAKVKFVPVPAAERFEVLRKGAIDILSRVTTWTLERDVGEGAIFAAVTYYDGQGFLVRRASGVTRVQQLDGVKVCVESGTTSEQNLADYARSMRVRITPVAARSADAVRAAFLARYCDAMTSDTAALAGFMSQQGGNEFSILFEVISKEPLGPVVRQDDTRLFNIARWVHFVMLAAEELGLDSKTVGELKAGTGSGIAQAGQEVQRLFGTMGKSGDLLGLDADWAARVVRQVGNYREVWERNIQPLGLQRGLNLLWNQGGLQYAPPVR